MTDPDAVLGRYTGRGLNADEAREAEEAGLLVVEATALCDPEPVFLVARAADEED